MSTFAICVALAAAAIVIVRIERLFDARKKEAIFNGRARLDPGQFYELYFRSLGVVPDTAIRVRQLLEDCLDYDLSRLSSSDDFSKNLRYFFNVDSMADVEMVMALEEEFDIQISDLEASETKTVEEIVMLVHRKTCGEESPNVSLQRTH